MQTKILDPNSHPKTFFILKVVSRLSGLVQPAVYFLFFKYSLNNFKSIIYFFDFLGNDRRISCAGNGFDK
jgi:hypothetical protein